MFRIENKAYNIDSLLTRTIYFFLHYIKYNLIDVYNWGAKKEDDYKLEGA